MLGNYKNKQGLWLSNILQKDKLKREKFKFRD